jgi:large subunit ribosomal protein L23
VNPHDIILKPVLSEKALTEVEASKYAFYVHPSANRTQVKDAVERVFGVDVVKLNLMNVRGKEKTLGRFRGVRPKRKKVIVTLKPGQRIQQLEGLT